MISEAPAGVHELLRLGKRKVERPNSAARIALLADTSSQILAGALRGTAYNQSMNLEIFESEFDQIDMQVLSPNSALHKFAPETAILFQSCDRLAQKFSMMDADERVQLSETFVSHVLRLHGRLRDAGYETICVNLADPGDGIFGHFANKVRSSLTFQIRTINFELMRLAADLDDFHICDLSHLQAEHGRDALFDPKLYWSAKMSLTPEACRLVAKELIQMISVRKGGGYKCVILDLDNTIWGGVIGDDGLQHIQIGALGLGSAFSHFQGWLKQLKERGVVLAVCSKNDETVARSPFENHPEMVLRLDDIAVFVANWQDKATNIRGIKDVIDIDYGAMVFLDDNPAERDLVRQSFPTMCVPEMSEDPCEYVNDLQRLNLFETTSYTALDVHRTRAYQDELQRRSEREHFVDECEFLSSLKMRVSVNPFSPFNFPRIAQLTQRSNQFNLRTIRYTEKQIAELADSSNHLTFCFELSDKFGDYGIVSLIVLERMPEGYFIDTWIMSCRVLGRGVERHALNTISAAVQGAGAQWIIGEYVPTKRNEMVADHYETLGFSNLEQDVWQLDVTEFATLPTQIIEDDQ